MRVLRELFHFALQAAIALLEQRHHARRRRSTQAADGPEPMPALLQSSDLTLRFEQARLERPIARRSSVRSSAVADGEHWSQGMVGMSANE